MWNNETDLTTSGLFVKHFDKNQLTWEERSHRLKTGAATWQGLKHEQEGVCFLEYFKDAFDDPYVRDSLVLKEGEYFCSPVYFATAVCHLCKEPLSIFNADPRDFKLFILQMGAKYSLKQSYVWMSNSSTCNECFKLQTLFEHIVDMDYREHLRENDVEFRFEDGYCI